MQNDNASRFKKFKEGLTMSLLLLCFGVAVLTFLVGMERQNWIKSPWEGRTATALSYSPASIDKAGTRAD